VRLVIHSEAVVVDDLHLLENRRFARVRGACKSQESG
jgi:hypothetical protein